MKRIIILSDGTGNSAARVWRTNVWRTFEALDLARSDQVAFYDDGVGTSSFKPLALLGGAFGYGLKRNVLDIYKFVCRNYRSAAEYRAVNVDSEDDQIFAFGFSRGAFTIRVVAGLIADQGLVSHASEEELGSKAASAYRAYRAKHYHSILGIERPARAIRSLFLSSRHDPNERPVKKIRFLGLWDTVAAYGLPVDEWTRGISQWIWPLELPSRRLHEKVERACHALSLDDERTTFHPVLWDESRQQNPEGPEWATESQTISQVWFAGVHANVGGGYPDDSLACVPLTWMMTEAAKCGLAIKSPPKADHDALAQARSSSDKDGRLYNPRSGVGGYYRYGPRKVHELSHMRLSKSADDKVEISLPKIHESVFGRIEVGAHGYAPIGLPETYAVVSNTGVVTRASATGERSENQELVWNLVWKRRVIYFLTVFASLYLIAYPLFRISFASDELSSSLRVFSDSIRLVGGFLPSLAKRWIDAYARDPGWFLWSAGWVALLILYGSRLGQNIGDRMRLVWNAVYPSSAPPRPAAGSRSVASTIGRILFLAVLVALIFADQLSTLLEYLARRSDTVSEIFEGPMKQTLEKLSAQPIPVFATVIFLVEVLPGWIIQTCRTSDPYKWVIRQFKLTILPAFFALLTVWLVVSFASHLLFDFRDGWGAFCKDETGAHYLDACKNEGLAQCGVAPANASGPVCAPQCTPYSREIDLSSSSDFFGKRDLCIPTGIRLERGATYNVSVEKLGEDWKLWGESSHTYGQPVSELPWWKQAAMVALYPFRRSLDRPWGSVIVRFGITGNEESFMDPDPVPVPSEHLSENMTPGKDGQMFIYLNKPVVGIPGVETMISNLIGSSAKARLTVKRTK